MSEDLRDELKELLTIQIALDDKIHRMQEELTKIKKLLLHTEQRLDIMKKDLNEEK